MKSAHRAAMLTALAMLAVPRVGPAQGIRIGGVTSAQVIDLRPLVRDSVPIGETTGEGLLRRSTSGAIVECVEGVPFCQYLRSGDRLGTMPLMQDLHISSWGLGQGISLQADLRFRGVVGDNPDLWPRANDNFDALTAFLQIDRSQWHARLGRMWNTSTFGMFNFDGASVEYRVSDRLSGEAYGGWGLAEGLNAPRTSSALKALEDIPPQDRGYLIGGALRWRPNLRSALSARYQREIRTDRGALYSERIALDGTMRFGKNDVSATYSQDLATNAVNEAHLRIRGPIYEGFRGAIEARHYHPFFELWTIWGAFAPVGYDEGLAEVSWQDADGRVAIDTHGGYRRYQETSTGLTSLPLRDDGWRVGADLTWRVTEAWSATGSYAADIGFGSARTDGDAGIRWQATKDLYVGGQVSAFQTIYEFRLGTGRVIGGGVNAGIRLNADTRIVGDVAIYHHRLTNATATPNWGQKRASLRVEWLVGRDPGMAAMEHTP